MTQLQIVDQLPFVEVTVLANNRSLHLHHVLLDTGSSATILKTDDMVKLGLDLLPTDPIREMFGIGGSEYVIEKQIAQIQIGELIAHPFTIQMGVLDYGIPLDGTLGLDFLIHVGATVDFKRLELR
jgi:predicted aspartyl protease